LLEAIASTLKDRRSNVFGSNPFGKGLMKSKKGAAEWYWIIIVIVIALVVAIFVLTMFTEFGAGIKASFTDILGLTQETETLVPPGG